MGTRDLDGEGGEEGKLVAARSGQTQPGQQEAARGSSTAGRAPGASGERAKWERSVRTRAEAGAVGRDSNPTGGRASRARLVSLGQSGRGAGISQAAGGQLEGAGAGGGPRAVSVVRWEAPGHQGARILIRRSFQRLQQGGKIAVNFR